MNSRLPTVLSPIDLPVAELSAARLDGDLFGLGGCFTPADLPEQAASRARSLAEHLTDRVIVELLSAAWVHGACERAPVAPQFCCSADARAKPATIRRLAVREVVIDNDEVLMLGDVRVTSPLRTACDLVKSTPDFEAGVQLIVMRLLAQADASVDDCIELLDRRRNLPGKRRTLERLRSLTLPRELRAGESAVADAVDVVNSVNAPHGVENPIEMSGVTHFEDELAQCETIG